MKVGNIELHIVSDGHFRLDGGAMFGVVPKALWQKLEPPDAQNRILMGLNCALVLRGDEKILIDTGIGDKFDDKFATIFGVERQATLIDNLARHGLQPADITHVIMSHMHFDHIGWNTRLDETGELVPTFANATYFAQNGEFRAANNPDARSRASYIDANWKPLETLGMLELLDGTGEILPGISSIVTGGHTAHHSIIKIDTGAGIVAFLADLVPTTSHLKTPYVMGFDLYPMQTMEAKPRVLQQAYEERWLLIFEHAAHIQAGYLQTEGKHWGVAPAIVDGKELT